VVVEVPRKLTGRQRELLEEYQRVSSGEEQGPLVGGFLESLKKFFGG
jgi:DnaJ-class molecular chaperone